MIKINENNKVEYVFINAWNEWGEGMYLEPDEKYKFEYLEAIKEALEEYKDETIPVANVASVNDQKIVERYRGYWKVLDQWLCIKEIGKSVSEYLNANNVRQIAIYGVGMLGKHLIKELENTEINIAYCVDRFVNSSENDYKTYSMDEKLPNVDAIIVTVIYDFENIRNQISKKFDGEIISLDTLINNTLTFNG